MEHDRHTLTDAFGTLVPETQLNLVHLWKQFHEWIWVLRTFALKIFINTSKHFNVLPYLPMKQYLLTFIVILFFSQWPDFLHLRLGEQYGPEKLADKTASY